ARGEGLPRPRFERRRSPREPQARGGPLVGVRGDPGSGVLSRVRHRPGPAHPAAARVPQRRGGDRDDARAVRAPRLVPRGRERAGHEIVDDPAAAELVLITTPDDRIAGTCDELAARRAFQAGQVVAHASGATGLEALASARRAGADVLSLHPLQTFPDADAAI